MKAYFNTSYSKINKKPRNSLACYSSFGHLLQKMYLFSILCHFQVTSTVDVLSHPYRYWRAKDMLCKHQLFALLSWLRLSILYYSATSTSPSSLKTDQYIYVGYCLLPTSEKIHEGAESVLQYNLKAEL